MMLSKKFFILCISIFVLSGLYVSFQGNLQAESGQESFYQDGVQMKCYSLGPEKRCEVDVYIYGSDDNFQNQLNFISSKLMALDDGSGPAIINRLMFSSSSDAPYEMTEEQWFDMQYQLKFSDIDVLGLSGIVFSSGSMPDNAFVNTMYRLRELYLPKITTVTTSSLQNLQGIQKLYIPSTVQTIESGALSSILDSQGSYIEIEGDFSQYYPELGSASRLTISEASNFESVDNIPYLRYFKGKDLFVNGTGTAVFDIDQLYGGEEGKANLETVYLHSSGPGIRVTNAPSLTTLFLMDSVTIFDIKNCSISTIPFGESTGILELDVSGNRLDFTSTDNQPFYAQYSTQFAGKFANQKPKLNVATMADIQLQVGDALPTITPTYEYADKTIIDFTQTPPPWMDASYFSNYTDNVTFSDSAIISTDKPKTFTRTYENERNEYIGSVNIVVSEKKETPIITLEKAGSTSPTSDDELTFTATVTKTGTEDINTDANVKFMDGVTQLREVPVVDGKAEYKTKLSAGQHSITAIYSGNASYNTVTSSPAIAITVTSPSSGLTAQTIGFLNSTVNMDLEDSVPSNPITQSDPHGTGAITYESSDTSVATVDSSGTVTVLKVGTTTIKATIAADSTYDSANGSYTLAITAPSALTAQTLSFDKTTESVCLGNPVNNPLTKDTPASTGAITYESSDETVATVDNTGAVTLLNAGSTIITATIAADSTYDTASASYTLNVSAVGELTTQTLEFSESSIAIIYGEHVNNSINQSNPHGTGIIAYESSDESIATVDSSGTVTVLKTGTTTITAVIAADATYASASDSYELTIAKKPVLVTGLLAKDKVYDGKTKVVFDTENAKAEGILAADVDNLRFMLGNGVYQDGNAGVDKAITLTDFSLQGSSAGNYELILPAITGTITKAELVVNVKDVERKEGIDNTELTYFITGFVNNETESTLTGYTKPVLETSATKTSPAGTYAITAKNASSDNYTFTYKTGTLSIKTEAVANDKSYTIEGVSGKNGWYTSKVKIKPSGNFTKIYNGKAWVSEVLYDDGVHKDIKVKFKQADDTESNEVTIAELKVDTTPPSVQNIKDGDTYFMNRAFQAKDDHVVKVRINGKEVTQAELQVIADTSKSYSIELEDEAGNVTSLKVDTKSLEEAIKPIEGITSESVEAKDKATIENMLAKVDDLLNDTSYSPTSEQKQQLEETKEKCETLLKQLATSDSENLPINNGVNTGDTSNILIYGCFCMLAIGTIAILKRRAQ